MYPCINNTMMNFVLIHPSVESDADTGDEGTLLSSHVASPLAVTKL
jgi:hypothetical protein